MVIPNGQVEIKYMALKLPSIKNLHWNIEATAKSTVETTNGSANL